MKRSRPLLYVEVGKLPWLADGIQGEDEPRAITHLARMSRYRESMTLRVVATRWIQDGLTRNEMTWLEGMDRLSANSGHGQTAARIVDADWMRDGPSGIETEATQDLSLIDNLVSPKSADWLSGAEWFADGIDQREAQALEDIRVMAGVDSLSAKRILRKAWLADGFDEIESSVLRDLRAIAELHPGGFAHVSQHGFLGDLSSVTLVALEAIVDLATEHPASFLELLDRREFRPDIFRTSWLHVIAMLDEMVDHDPELLHTLMSWSATDVEIDRGVLNITGTTTLALVRTGDEGEERTTHRMEYALWRVESIMDHQLPLYPPAYQALLITDAVPHGWAGHNYGTFAIMGPEYENPFSRPDTPMMVLARTFAAHYWNGNAEWVDHGIASLMGSYVNWRAGGAEVTVWSEECEMASSIFELDALGPSPGSREYDCYRSMGERMFYDIYREIGGQRFWRGVRNLYATSHEGSAQVADIPPTRAGLVEVRRAFGEISRRVIPIIDRWYYGRP